MKKKAFSLLLALCMALALLPAAALAADSDFTIEDDYKFPNNSTEDGVLTKYNGPGGDVVIPDGVTIIWSIAFYDCTSMTSVTIPNSVTEISSQAFEGCTNLTSVTIPASVASIGYSAFRDCTSLSNLTIQNGITSIGWCAFFGCSSLTSITIPESVSIIEMSAFGNCTSLTSITIPDNVTEIWIGAFNGCSNLTDVYYGGSEEQWNAIQIENNNEPLTNATIHYNSPMPEAPTIPAAPTVGGFDDVKADEYYAEPVLWAVEKGITVGTSGNSFSPDDTCTHIQIITFLWRAAGRLGSDVTAPVSASLAGVDDYVSAANWAYGKGIIGNDFNPNAPCTRSDTVNYMWKADGSPDIFVSSNFTDIPSDAVYGTAVMWAVDKGVTMGTDDTHFSPDDTCTRGEIVTFLYRAFA